MAEELGITVSKKDNINEWYREVILKSGLAEYSSVSGCFVFKPLSYSIWEKVKEEVDRRFKDIGIQNAYFPLFIPEKLLEKEAEHFEGFNPEVAWVTQAGSSELDEKLAVRPTSETIMYDSYRDWIRSWRDLPLKINQWNNIVRWEFKHATPFLRTREFLWNEGHNVYANEEKAHEDRDKVLGIYKEVLEDWMALPGIMGRKSEKEKFAGAVDSYSIEHILPDGKAIQGPDYHYDGKNFAKAFDITYTNEDEEERYPYQTTYAITTRQLGIMVMVHSDDRGLVVPPRLAPTKVVVVPIPGDREEQIQEKAKEVSSMLQDCELDDREEYTPGWKFNHWEVKGVPLRIEIGSKEVENEELTLVRRDNQEKIRVDESETGEKVKEVLEDIQENLLENAREFMEESIQETESYEELKKIVDREGGFVKAPWCGDTQCEEEIKDETGAKTTNIPFRYDEPEGKECVRCGREATDWVHFAKSY